MNHELMSESGMSGIAEEQAAWDPHIVFHPDRTIEHVDRFTPGVFSQDEPGEAVIIMTTEPIPMPEA